MATEYLLFRQPNDPELHVWEILDEPHPAASSDAAIRAAAVQYGPGTYAAVPARSWQPRTVKVEARASFAKDAT